MNRFLATTAVALMLGAAPVLAQTPASPGSPAPDPSAQAPMQPEPPLAIPSEPDMKALDQSSEGPKVITPDQSTEAAKPMAPEQSTAQGGQFLKEQTADDMLASSIIGKPAVNSQDETIGDVNDLVTDRSGKITAALIGVGGFLGIGEKDVAVRFEDLKLNRDENDNVKVTLNISKETLAEAPDYKLLGEEPIDRGGVGRIAGMNESADLRLQLGDRRKALFHEVGRAAAPDGGSPERGVRQSRPAARN
jgi:sporulation protein YlmC with PRC-barrel domain